MKKSIVHFIDEHGSHYEAVVYEQLLPLASLYVWAHGHVRITKLVPHSVEYKPLSWHAAHLQLDGKSICEGNGGYVMLSEDERALFYKMVDKITAEQGA